jgi:hypothetical protein
VRRVRERIDFMVMDGLVWLVALTNEERFVGLLYSREVRGIKFPSLHASVNCGDAAEPVRGNRPPMRLECNTMTELVSMRGYPPEIEVLLPGKMLKDGILVCGGSHHAED